MCRSGEKDSESLAVEGSMSDAFKPSGVFQDGFTSATEVFLAHDVREAGGA